MKVVIGVDHSEFSDDAVRHVVDSTWPEGTTFVVVSAIPPVFIGAGEVDSPRAYTDIMQEQERGHKEIADAAMRSLAAAGLKATARTPYGDPRMVLEEAARAERADLLVVGSHGRSGIQRLLLGSVASHVVTHAPCPVLVVRVPAWKRGETDRKAAESGMSVSR